MGSIYFNLEPGDVRNRVAGMSMYIAFVSFMTFDILMLWPAERSIYLRDQISGMYCTSAFYTARSFAEAPTHMLCGAIGALLTCYMYGLQSDAEHVLMYVFISVITVMTASSILMWVSSLAKNFEQSNQLLMPILLPCMFFSGFFITEVRPDRHLTLSQSFPHTKMISRCGSGHDPGDVGLGARRQLSLLL